MSSSPRADEPETYGAVLARTTHPDPYVRKAALRELANTWPDRAETMATLRHALRHDPDLGVRRGTVANLLAVRWQHETLPWLRDLANSEHASDRLTAVVVFCVVAWTPGKEHFPEVFAVLRARAFDDVAAVRYSALKELMHNDRDAPETVAVFRDRARDPDPLVRRMAISALGGRDDPESVEVLYRLATTDEDEEVRETALLRTKSWPDRAEAIAWLREHAAGPDYVTPTDPDHILGVPELATTLLVDLRYGDPRVRAQVLDLLTRSRDDAIRCLVLTHLAVNKPSDPHTGEVLRRLVRHEPSTAVRLAALRAFRWRRTPECLAVLRERAIAEPDPETRRAALEWLWFDEESRELLLRRTAEDPAAENRVYLVEALAERARHDPDPTRPARALDDRVRHDPHKRVRRVARKALVALAKAEAELEFDNDSEA